MDKMRLMYDTRESFRKPMMASNPSKPTYIYVLQCEDHTYYVGQSTDLRARVRAHFRHAGSAWTQLHPPTKLLEYTPLTHPLDEDHLTERLMFLHGMNQVRGGSYASVKLAPDQVSTLRRKQISAENRCLYCLELGHFRSQCPHIKTDIAEALAELKKGAHCE